MVSAVDVSGQYVSSPDHKLALTSIFQPLLICFVGHSRRTSSLLALTQRWFALFGIYNMPYRMGILYYLWYAQNVNKYRAKNSTWTSGILRFTSSRIVLRQFVHSMALYSGASYSTSSHSTEEACWWHTCSASSGCLSTTVGSLPTCSPQWWSRANPC